VPKTPNPDIVKNEPVISSKKPNNQERSLDNFNKLSDNSLLTAESEKNLAITSYKPQKLIYGIPTKNQGKFSLNASEQLPLITNKKEQPTGKERILLEKIRNLEEQLKQTRTENKNLTTKLAQSEALSQSEKQRANYYQQQLKSIAKSLYQ